MKNKQMARKSRVSNAWWISGLILVVGLGFILGLGQMNAVNAAATSNKSMPKYQGRSVPASFPQYPPGIPAIHSNLIPASKVGPSLTFTAADAKQYVTNHPFWNTNIQVNGSFNVTKVTFLTSRALSIQLHGESIGRPDTAMVCYVELHGTFIFAGAKSAITTHLAYEVFDAQSGNLILTGGKVR